MFNRIKKTKAVWDEMRGWNAAKDIPRSAAKEILSTLSYWDVASERDAFKKGWYKRLEVTAKGN